MASTNMRPRTTSGGGHGVFRVSWMRLAWKLRGVNHSKEARESHAHHYWTRGNRLPCLSHSGELGDSPHTYWCEIYLSVAIQVVVMYYKKPRDPFRAPRLLSRAWVVGKALKKLFSKEEMPGVAEEKQKQLSDLETPKDEDRPEVNGVKQL